MGQDTINPQEEIPPVPKVAKFPLAVTVVLSLFGLGFIIFALILLFGGVLEPPEEVSNELETTEEAVQPTDTPDVNPTAVEDFASSCENPVTVNEDEQFVVCVSEVLQITNLESYGNCMERFNDTFGTETEGVSSYREIEFQSPTNPKGTKIAMAGFDAECSLVYKLPQGIQNYDEDDLKSALIDERYYLFNSGEVVSGLESFIVEIYDFKLNKLVDIGKDVTINFIYSDDSFAFFASQFAEGGAAVTIQVYDAAAGLIIDEHELSEELLGEGGIFGKIKYVSSEGSNYNFSYELLSSESQELIRSEDFSISIQK
ncbi:MAG: hypothetical protein ACE5DX_04630 [Candidatus Dojkabacteria bacterium]